ncbi:MAG: hypothetical protein Q9M50_02320 [Methylococcales bacterium]|nr:hypothetical protein [Methylococcales bacterium]
MSCELTPPVKLSAHRVGNLWRRLNAEQQKSLAKGNVFPAEMLSEAEAEQINLLKNQWQPLGPVGIEGQEYQSKILYILKDISEDKIEPAVLLAGLQADASHPVMIPIPEQGGLIRFEFKMLDGSPLPDNIPMNLRWFGRGREERWQHKSIWKADNIPSYPLKGGLLDVRPLAAVIIKVTLDNGDGIQQDITPEPLRIKSYFTNVNMDFKIEHLNGLATPMRFDVRRFFSPEILTKASTVLEYQWLDAQQTVLNRGSINLIQPASIYDRLKSITDVERISDPESFYWLLPEAVKSVRFKSLQKNTLVNAYIQPSGLIKRNKIPEDSYVSLDKQLLQPSWFPIQPMDLKPLFKQQQLLWVIGQYHPPEEKEDLLANDYLWNEFLPEKPYQAHYLLDLFFKKKLIYHVKIP